VRVMPLNRLGASSLRLSPECTFEIKKRARCATGYRYQQINSPEGAKHLPGAVSRGAKKAYDRV
jgi:hypothetical protein